jgi:transposase
MSARDVPVKKYLVRLSAEEREQLHAMVRKGKSSAQRLMKARILLKADVSEGGEGWSDSQIIKALETSATTVYRTRQQLVEEGLEAVLSRKKPSRPSVPRIFDGEKEAKLIALACSEPPEGRARWTLRLLENKVVELDIVERASDSTIGRVLKNSTQAAPQNTMGHPAGGKRRLRSRHGGRAIRVYAPARSGSATGLSG